MTIISFENQKTTKEGRKTFSTNRKRFTFDVSKFFTPKSKRDFLLMYGPLPLRFSHH